MSAWMVAQPSRGSIIFWGSDFQDLLYDASGNALDGSFSFEIGSFAGGFVPTTDNINEWAANWKVLDRAFDPTPDDPNDDDPEGWNSNDQFFVGTVEHRADGTSGSPDADPSSVFTQGEVAYLWVYNTKDRNTGTEWALVTDGVQGNDTASDWIFPDPAEPASTSYDWLLPDADEAVFGGLNGTLPGGQPFRLQTSLVPVPEPGALVLGACAVMAALLQRRRSVKVSDC